MAYIWNKEYTKSDLLQRIGDITQIAGTKSYVLNDGKAFGVRGIDVKTGSGLEFTIIPDRCMDIAWASYNGKALSLLSKNGIVSSKYYEPEENGWFRSFFAGLLTTCGLSNTGAYCEVDGEKFGLHGRISNTPAEKVNINEYWLNDDFFIEVSGKMRETNFYGENLLLTRTIKTKLGDSKLIIEDYVENLGYSEVPLSILYHFNLGFPVVDESSELIINSSSIESYDQESGEGILTYNKLQKPTHEYFRQVFFHKPKVDVDGNACCAIINHNLDGNKFGVYLKYNQSELPELFEFKMMGQSDYVVGLEPSNCMPMGRKVEKSRDGLKYLAAGESKKFYLEIGVVNGDNEVNELVTRIMK